MKKYNLTDLLGGKIEIEIDLKPQDLPIDGIKIPIIQRDYVQGQEKESIIRHRFLDAIFNAMIKGEELELDFVYGSIENLTGTSKGNHRVFLPLDGQQRLTTLFLIYWYVISVELSDEKQAPLRQKLARFSYATRSTAREFCEKLSTKISLKQEVKKNIKNAYWFHSGFKQDPTVMAMLNTLHDIEKKYSQLQFPIYENLSNLSFYILPLEDFNLTDELYIKMNSRGKQLTDFENFKADLINWMKDSGQSNSHEFLKDVQHFGKSMPYYVSIASKIDNTWTDIFWPTAVVKVKDEDKIVDPYFLRFINRYLLNHHIVNSTLSIAEGETFKYLYDEKENDSTIKYEQFDTYKSLLNFNVIHRFEKMMDNLNMYQDEIRDAIKPSWDDLDDWFMFDDKAITQPQRILFFAITQYLENDYYETDRFKEWIRVVWNIIIDPDIRSIDAMITAMRLISSLSNGSNDIYKFLVSNEFDSILSETASFYHLQLKEEKDKVIYFKQNGWKEIIIQAESHPLFKGNIGFLISNNPNLALFELRLHHASVLFNRTGTNKSFRNDFGVYRYVISQFLEWNQIQKFIYADDGTNWQLNLRRNHSCKKSISILCSCPNLNSIKEKIDLALSQPSSVKDASGYDLDQVRMLHRILYIDECFVAWTQKKEIRHIKWFDNNIYITKAYHRDDWVMLNSIRHNLIAKFCELAGIDTENRCDKTDFFSGVDIVIKVPINGKEYRVLFNRYNQVDVRTLQETNDILGLELIHGFPKLIEVNSELEARELAEQIYQEMRKDASPSKIDYN